MNQYEVQNCASLVWTTYMITVLLWTLSSNNEVVFWLAKLMTYHVSSCCLCSSEMRLCDWIFPL